MSARHTTRTLGAVLLLMLAACGEPPARDPDDAVTAKLPPAKATEETTALGPFAVNSVAQPSATENIGDGSPPANPDDAAQPAPGGDSRYTSLDASACTPIAGNGQDGPTVRRRCTGPVSYALETADTGQQQDLAIIAPDGQRAELDVPKLSNVRLGKTAEWRRDGSGRPRALIVRVNADADGGPNSRVSHLLVTRLAMPACVVAIVPRGPGQNEKARAIADAKRLECIKQ